jgi:hypothetical protein
MQKVVYVLLQQHAERYWQADHDDESDEDTEDNTYGKILHNSYNILQTHFNFPYKIDAPRRRYRTIGHRTERDRRCLSMVDTNNNNNGTISARKNSATAVGNRPVAPWMPSDASVVPPSPTLPTNKNDVLRRYSAATIRADRSPAFEDLPASPPLPPTDNEKKTATSKMKKSETFYARFVKNVLSSGRRSSKDTR